MGCTCLVGYTGFVGSNLDRSAHFDCRVNSRTVQTAYGLKPDLLVYAGVRAEKYLANQEPEKDMRLIRDAIENIKKINPKKLVLISTIDVYKNPVDVDEDSPIDVDNLLPYGRNRYFLEQWCRENIDDCMVVRLPGLYGNNIKKNFIYDYINIIPSMIRNERFQLLTVSDEFLKSYYVKLDNGFYRCRDLNEEEKKILRTYLLKSGFTALNFTDSRAVFQFYPLKRLWSDIMEGESAGIALLNLSTEPIGVSVLYEFLSGKKFENELDGMIPYYNFKSKYASSVFGGSNGYLLDRKYIMQDIKRFIELNNMNL